MTRPSMIANGYSRDENGLWKKIVVFPGGRRIVPTTLIRNDAGLLIAAKKRKPR